MNYEKKHPILQKLEEYFNNTPKEQIDKDWSNILKDTDSEAYYEQKYNEALERAKEELRVCGSQDCDAARQIFRFFPELAESEDERVRKEIIQFLELPHPQFVGKRDHEKWIAWLEKQGNINETSAEWSEEDKQMILSIEQVMNCASLLNIVPEKIDNIKSWLKSLKPQKQWKPNAAQQREIDDAYLQGICDAKNVIEKQGEQKPTKNIVEAWKDMRLEVYQQASGNRHEPNYSDDTTKMFSLNDIDEIIEKMSEQSHADKVEPKFKVGDWVIFPLGIIAHIDSLNSTDYQVTTTDGKIFNFKISKQDNYHLWSIKDAKDGDVLMTEDFIFIFKYILHGGVHIYCHYNFDDEEFDSDIPDAVIGNIRDKGIHFRPATKKQRELLFSKMKELGYEWNAEKKELKKVEPKKLDADKVIGWIERNASMFWDSPCNPSRIVELFKIDFGL